MRFLRPLSCSLLLLLVCLAGSIRLPAQTIQPFNRFQYGKQKWKTFQTTAFHIYFTEGNDSICSFIARELAGATELVKARMVSSLDWQHTPCFIIYPSLAKQYERNIGGSQIIPVTLPTLVIKGNRMVLHFTGSYADIKQQLYDALARACGSNSLKQRKKTSSNWYQSRMFLIGTRKAASAILVRAGP